MTSDVTDTGLEEQPEERLDEPQKERPRKRRWADLEPGLPYAVSTVLWMLMLIGMARNPYFVEGDAGTRNARGVAWFDLALLVLVVAIIAGGVYIVDQRRRRSHHPRGYRHPSKTRPRVVEVLTWLFLVVYTLLAFSSLGLLAVVVYDLIPSDQDPVTWLTARAALLPIVLIVYTFHLIVLPWSGTAFVLNLRHKRQYPDPTHRDTPGFRRSSIALLAVSAILVLLIVAVELLVPSGPIG